MSTLRLVHDRDRHGTATVEPQHKSVDIGCPSLGSDFKDFSPFDMVASGLASCMLFSMGSVARRNHLDLSQTTVDVDHTWTSKPYPHIETISLTFHVPRDFGPEDRQKLERAAGLCPIKTSFGPDTEIKASFTFGSSGEEAA